MVSLRLLVCGLAALTLVACGKDESPAVDAGDVDAGADVVVVDAATDVVVDVVADTDAVAPAPSGTAAPSASASARTAPATK